MKRPSASAVLRSTTTIVVLGLLLWLTARFANQYIVPFAHWVRGLGVWGPIAYIAAYAIADIVLIPGSILTLAAGTLFGLVAGSTYAFIGAMIGSIATFFIGRYLVRPIATRRLQDNEHFKQIDAAAASGGMKLVALLRLSPLLPYTVLNYALGISRIGARDYIIGSAAILPGTIVYTYYGTVVANLSGITDAVQRGPAYYVLTTVGVIATIVATALIARLARRQLRDVARD